MQRKSVEVLSLPSLNHERLGLIGNAWTVTRAMKLFYWLLIEFTQSLLDAAVLAYGCGNNQKPRGELLY